MTESFYVTTPIYYVNAEPHIGHAYTTVVADVLNRFHQLAGRETFFLTGTDEHGDKIVSAAKSCGETPKAYVDRISHMFQALWPRINISNNQFIRTTDAHHQKTVQEILTLVKEKGDIYFSEYEGLYCFGCERFYTEKELVDGKCPDHQTEPAALKEANYFFRMSRYQDWLVNHITENPDFIRPERYKNEVLSFLSDPLDDLCISRPKSRLTWGITLPFDDNFVTYVWFDALINYVSALEYPDGEHFKAFWPAAQHMIAKDILKPHGIYWPCMLKSAGIEPYCHLNVHGYWNIDEGKMSKSVGNVVDPLSLVDVYGLDPFRYFLMREMAFGLDSEFSEKALVQRLNADLANDLGNLVSRSLSMIHKYFDGTLPEAGPADEEDDALKNAALSLIDDYDNMMHQLGFHKALMAVWRVIGDVNRYIDNMAPWVLAKSNPDRLKTVMRHIFECLRVVAGLVWPFMPESAVKIQEQMGLAKKGADCTLKTLGAWGSEMPGHPIKRAKALFPRIEVKKEADQKQPDEKPGKTRKKPGKKEEKKHSTISFSEFQNLDLRIGLIQDAAEIPGSRKLLKLTVDVGETRTVVAGLKEHYAPRDLIGKQILVVANLEPAKLMGVESQGMLLAAGDEDGLRLMIPEVAVKPGSKVK